MKRNLRTRTDNHAVIFIPVCNDNMGLNMSLLDLGDIVGILKNLVGLFEPLIDISNVDPDFCRDVFIGIGICKINVFCAYEASSNFAV